MQTFTDQASGSKDDREVFWQAVEAARKAKATLVVSKLDRLSRSGIRFMVELEKIGVPYVAADNPGMTKLVVHILAAVAEDERQRIRQRTREGLAAARAKGIKLGNPKWRESIGDARKARAAKVAKQRELVLPTIKALQASGITTLTGLADALNDRNIRPPRGHRWHPMTVSRLITEQAGRA